MRCRSCDFDNPPGLKFCGNCGARARGFSRFVGRVREMEGLNAALAEALERIRRSLAARPDLRHNGRFLLCIVPAMLATEGAAASAEITALIEELLRAARERGFVMVEPFALQHRGELAALLGDEPASRRDRRAAADLFRRLDCPARAEAIRGRA